MDSGRKRIPLGALSPSSARTGQRRRCSENDHSCLDAVENVDPNTTSGTGTTTFGCRDGFLTPSQRRLHGVDLSKVSTPAPGFQDRLGTQSPTRITQKGFIGSSQASGPSPPVFTSRLTNRSMNSSIKKTTFQLPASQITPKNTPQSSGNNVQLGRTVNLLNKHTYQGPHAIPMKTNKTASTSTSTNTPDSEITVLVPELDRISVRRPVWYQDQTKGSVANLLNSFNSVDEPSSSRGCKDTDHAEDDDADVQEGICTETKCVKARKCEAAKLYLC